MRIHSPSPKLVAVMVVGILLLLATPYQRVAEAQSDTSSFSLTISGSNVILNTSIDLCQALRYVPFSGVPSTCPFNLSFQEQYNQQLIGSVTTAATFLAQSDRLSLDVAVEPDLPLASLSVEASVGTNALPVVTYNVNYSAVGESSVLNIHLPLQQIIDYLAQSVPALSALGTYISSLNAKLTTADKVSAGFQGAGFSGGQDISWSTAAPQAVSVDFGGSDSSPILGMALHSEQSWQLIFEAEVKGVPLQVGSYPVSITFNSPTKNLFQWQRVLGVTGYSTVPGSGWYLSGRTATLSIGSTTVSLGPGERAVFRGWVGSGTGSFDSDQPSIALTANSPVTETAQWLRQDAVSFHVSGGKILGASNNSWYDQGSQLELNANPSLGYKFKDWTVDGNVVSTSPTLSYVVESPSLLHADFVSTSPQPSIDPPEVTALLLIGLALVVIVAIVFDRRFGSDK